MNEMLNKLYEITQQELKKLTDKGSLSVTELENAKCAVELLHKIRHFEDDEDKYGWNEDGIVERMYTRHPMQSYTALYGNHRNGATYGNETMHMDREALVRDAQRMMGAATSDSERMDIIRYINRIGS